MRGHGVPPTKLGEFLLNTTNQICRPWVSSDLGDLGRSWELCLKIFICFWPKLSKVALFGNISRSRRSVDDIAELRLHCSKLDADMTPSWHRAHLRCLGGLFIFQIRISDIFSQFCVHILSRSFQHVNEIQQTSHGSMQWNSEVRHREYLPAFYCVQCCRYLLSLSQIGPDIPRASCPHAFEKCALASRKWWKPTKTRTKRRCHASDLEGLEEIEVVLPFWCLHSVHI